MSRFQAKTNAVLDAELDELRRRLGLRPNQKADLLRELTVLASWVVRQAAEGRSVIARGDDDVRELVHPVIDRIRRANGQGAVSPMPVALDDDEVARLAEILDRGFDPPDALIFSLRRMADQDREPPELTWPDRLG